VVTHPSPPQIRTCRFPASGSSPHEFAASRVPRSVVVSLTRNQVSAYLACFPPTVFVKWCPLPSTGSLGMVPPLRRYYEALRSPDSHFAALRFLRLAIPWSVWFSSPCGLRHQADGSSWSLLYRLLPIRPSSRNCPDLPSSQGTLVTIRPVLRPRRDRICGLGPVVNRSGKAPASNHNGGSPQTDDFGAQSHGIWSGCLRLAGRVAPPPRKTRFRLLVPSNRAGFAPAGFYRKVSE
jgi:hypothetical protein